jgi:excinuclease ABC subunit A
MRHIQIRNARAHNLKNIDIDIPKGKFIVITGVSGSGKSSLVFDTMYKEGCNLYLGFIGYSQGIGDRKTFDSINGLCPIIAVEQKILRFSNPRSTVGTKTSLNALLRSLYAAEGKNDAICVIQLYGLEVSVQRARTGRKIFIRPS